MARSLVTSQGGVEPSVSGATGQGTHALVWQSSDEVAKPMTKLCGSSPGPAVIGLTG